MATNGSPVGVETLVTPVTVTGGGNSGSGGGWKFDKNNIPCCWLGCDGPGWGNGIALRDKVGTNRETCAKKADEAMIGDPVMVGILGGGCSVNGNQLVWAVNWEISPFLAGTTIMATTTRKGEENGNGNKDRSSNGDGPWGFGSGKMAEDDSRNYPSKKVTYILSSTKKQ